MENYPGEACDVCGEVVTATYPRSKAIDFTAHNREAYDRHLALTGQEYARQPQEA